MTVTLEVVSLRLTRQVSTHSLLLILLLISAEFGFDKKKFDKPILSKPAMYIYQKNGVYGK